MPGKEKATPRQTDILAAKAASVAALSKKILNYHLKEESKAFLEDMGIHFSFAGSNAVLQKTEIPSDRPYHQEITQERDEFFKHITNFYAEDKVETDEKSITIPLDKFKHYMLDERIRIGREIAKKGKLPADGKEQNKIIKSIQDAFDDAGNYLKRENEVGAKLELFRIYYAQSFLENELPGAKVRPNAMERAGIIKFTGSIKREEALDALFTANIGKIYDLAVAVKPKPLFGSASRSAKPFAQAGLSKHELAQSEFAAPKKEKKGDSPKPSRGK